MQDYKHYGNVRSRTAEVFAIVAAIAVGILIGMTFGEFSASVTFKFKDDVVQERQGQIMIDCNKCHNRQMAMTRYFESRGNPTPEQMAVAVLKTKSPRLMAAIAVKGERNTPYWVRNGGYKKRHAGAWQMSKENIKAYGPVPFEPVGQALQAEKFLVDLTQEKPIKQALNMYGGDSTDAYSKRVLAELVNIP